MKEKDWVGSFAEPTPDLLFEGFRFAHGIRLAFAKAEDPELRIVTVDAEMNAGEVLLKEAKPAL